MAAETKEAARVATAIENFILKSSERRVDGLEKKKKKKAKRHSQSGGSHLAS